MAFEEMANLATKAGVEGNLFKIHTPLIYLKKTQIIQEGLRLGIDYSLTISCYQANSAGYACGVCDACRLRAEGFRFLGIADPTRYLTQSL
jgi:7-cyano-7-deazaguanine synthase